MVAVAAARRRAGHGIRGQPHRAVRDRAQGPAQQGVHGARGCGTSASASPHTPPSGSTTCGTTSATSTSYRLGNIGGVMTSAASAAGSFLPHSLGSDRVSDNVKSLFPSSSTASGAASAGHDEYRASPPDLLSHPTSNQQPQELCLTLQSNQHQIFSHVSSNHHV
uniref:Uncharacterized protein n=1 Tax=Oryza punctata TaxID=4537 RepID=A0A0E0LZU7_ORYPU